MTGQFLRVHRCFQLWVLRPKLTLKNIAVTSDLLVQCGNLRIGCDHQGNVMWGLLVFNRFRSFAFSLFLSPRLHLFFKASCGSGWIARRYGMVVSAVLRQFIPAVELHPTLRTVYATCRFRHKLLNRQHRIYGVFFDLAGSLCSRSRNRPEVKSLNSMLKMKNPCMALKTLCHLMRYAHARDARTIEPRTVLK